MMHSPAHGGFADPEVAEIARFGLTALRGSAAIFFWVGDSPIGMTDVEVAGVSQHFFPRYAAEVAGHDPLNVRRMQASGQRVAQFAREAGPVDPYASFLGGHGIVEVIDLLFWSGGAPVAGLGILKRPDDPPATPEALEMAAATQRLVEFNLQRHERVARMRLRKTLADEFGLTNAELRVVALVMEGCSNGEIAERLTVSLPTVKTHLLHILSKTGCRSRAALMASGAALEGGKRFFLEKEPKTFIEYSV